MAYRGGGWGGGDFNKILHSLEQEEGWDRSQTRMDVFNAILLDCTFTDVGFKGSPFTWSNNRLSANTVCCHLDCVCANGAGLQRFPSLTVTHLPLMGSDHCTLLLQLQPSGYQKGSMGGRLFRFESLWLSKAEPRRTMS